ncbi:MAG: hypothetical protein LBF82_02725 [Lactobacillales bacterium]|jgi:hypothetical protein|nr:hypothetical protein [Lactobacillales bacterium]
MFSFLIQKSLEYVKNFFRSKVDKTMNIYNVANQIEEVKTKSNNIVSDAEIANQTEIIKRVLKVRQEEIDKKLQAQKNVRQVKDLTRQGIYTTLIKKNEKEKNKEKNKEINKERKIYKTR